MNLIWQFESFMPFWYRIFSQGSVATYARCGGFFNNHFIADFPDNLPVKKNNKNWLRFHELLPCVCCLRFYWDMVYSVNNRYLSIFKRCWVMPESCKTFSGSWKSPGMFLQLESVDGGLVVCVCVVGWVSLQWQSCVTWSCPTVSGAPAARLLQYARLPWRVCGPSSQRHSSLPMIRCSAILCHRRTHTHAHMHTRLNALFWDYPCEPVPKR